MMHTKDSKRFLFLVGPTATGKSDWALELAQKTKSCILNCDSIQVYKELQCGSARPDDETLKSWPHGLYAYMKAPAEITAGQYRRDFFQFVENHSEFENFIVVGGTGFYFQALEKGLFELPQIAPDVRKKLEEEADQLHGLEKLHSELQQRDFTESQRIHPADRYRIVRALEILRGQSKKLSEIRRDMETNAQNFPFFYLKTGIQMNREKLREQIQKRTTAMLKAGLLSEVQALLDRGLEHWAPLSSVGYKESCQFLRGEIKEQELLELIVTHTFQLAKRQRTWFQRDQQIKWFDSLSERQQFLSLGEQFFMGTIDPVQLC